MTSETSGNVRTLLGYASDLLKYPRFVVERDVDFTDCRHGGRHNASVADCSECEFGEACRWLDYYRSPNLKGATLDELTDAIKSACDYMQSKVQEGGECDAEMRAWIREARRFLQSCRQ